MTQSPTRAAPGVALITTIPAADSAVVLRTPRVLEHTPARTVSVSTRPIGRRLALVIAAGALADVAVLGAAGWLFGLSEAGRQLAAALVVLAVIAGLLLAAAGTGRVHCPGCPR